MSQLQVTEKFLDNLVSSLQDKYGNGATRDELIGIVATSLGWQPAPFMRTLKSAANAPASRPVRDASSLGERSFVTFSSRPHDIEIEKIENERPLEKLGTMSETEVSQLIAFGKRPSGLILVTGVEKPGASTVTGSLARSWKDQLGPSATLSANVFDHDHPWLPYSKELSPVQPTLDHAVSTSDGRGPKPNFAIMNIVGSPSNVIRAIRSSNIMPTIASIDSELLGLITGKSDRAPRYWSLDRREPEALLTALAETVGFVVETRMPASRFLKTKVLTRSEWLKSI